MTEIIKTDVLVIGGGAAAARAGLEASNLGARVALVDKGRLGNSGSSPRCLLGICVPLALGDSPEAFFEDWTRVSCGISDHPLIWECASSAAANILQLVESGLDFAKERGGKYYLYQGAGHSRPRNLTIQYKRPGTNLMTVLGNKMKRRGGRILEGIFITTLLKTGNAVTGAVGITSRGDVTLFRAKAVVLACGGANRMFPCNPGWIRDETYRTTGDAFALAFHAGATLVDLEFPNFRESPPGATRGGGKYFNAGGERFMERYDPVALEKAPRQLTVSAVYTELKEGRGPVYWHVDKELLERDPSMSARFGGRRKVKLGIEFQRLLGGVRINEKAETDVPHLFAAGESSGGVHGADRMQGTSFLETQIFGARAGYHAATLALRTGNVDIDMKQVEEETARIKGFNGDIRPSLVRKAIQETMWEEVGIIRSADSLLKAAAAVSRLKKEQIPRLSGKTIFSAVECLNLLLTAEMIIHAALKREESRGSHRRKDFPDSNNTYGQKHVAIRKADGKIAVTTIPVSHRDT